jgi:vacuolar protein sorting-associated protein 13A/C
MFESIVSDILVKSLGKYIELDASQLSLGVWSGDVQLRDLVLRPDALASLNLPIAIKYGTIGRLTLKVPWKSLRSSPVIVEISDVVLLVTPQDSTTFVYDDAKEAANALKRKLDALDEAEAIKQMRLSSADADAADKGFAAKLVTTIIGNIQVTVTSVHVRFEDSTAAGVPFALGLTVDSLTARSTDADWRLGAFIDPSVSPIMHKLVQLSSAALYLDAHSAAHLSMLKDGAAIRQAMLAMVARENSPASLHQYVVAPMHAELRARINDKDNDLTIPKVRVEAALRMVDIELERHQYLDLLRVTESLSAYAVSIKNLKYRPRDGSRPFNNPRAWWRYAINVVLDDVRERGRRWSWKFMNTYRRQRSAYVALYKRTQHVHWLKPLAKAEQDALRKQEEELGYEDVLLFRAFATAELQSERARADAKLDEQRAVRAKQSWFTRLTSGIKKASADDVKMSEHERDDLYASIGFDQAMSQFELPHDYVQTTAQIALGGFALVLRNGADTLMRATIADLAAQCTDSARLDAGRRLAPAPARRRSLPRRRPCHCVQRAVQTERQRAGRAGRRRRRCARTPLLALQFEKAPLDGRADNALRVRMRPLDIIVDKPFLDRLGAFVVQETPVDLSNAKQRLDKTVEQVRANTRSRLESAIAMHNTIDIDVEIEAPFVIVPDHATRPDAMALILDFGSLTVRSNLVDEKKDERTEDDYYDKFDVGIKSVKVLLAPLDTQWWRVSVQDELALRLVDDVAVNVQLMQCIDQEEASLPRLRLRGSLERVAVHFSSSRYARLMRVAAVFEAPPAIAGAVPVPARAVRVPKRPAVVAAPSGAADGDVKRKTKRKHERRGTKVAAIAEATDHTFDKSLESIAARTAESRVAERQLLAKRVEMRAEFTVGELVVMVARDGVGVVAGAAQPMVRVRVERLGVSFEQLSFSMSASVALKEIAIDDLMQRAEGAAFSRLLSTTTSSPSAAGTVAADDDASAAVVPVPTAADNFVDIKYDAITDKHPDYARVDSTVSIAVSTLFVFVNRDTVSELIRFGLIDLAQAGSNKADAAAAAHRAEAAGDGKLGVPRARSGSIALADAVVSSLVGSLRLASPALAGTIERALGIDDSDDDEDDDDDGDGDGDDKKSRRKRRRRVRTTMRLDLKVRRARLRAERGVWRASGAPWPSSRQRRLASSWSTCARTRRCVPSGELQSIALTDVVAKSAQERYWAILAPTDEAASRAAAMIEFGYDTFNKRRSASRYPGWDAAARVRVASMRAVLLYAFVLQAAELSSSTDRFCRRSWRRAAPRPRRARRARAAAAAAAAIRCRTRASSSTWSLKSFFVQVPETADSDNHAAARLRRGH